MKRLGLIIQREYMQMVAKKSFIFTTILLPILMLAVCCLLPVALANVKSDEQKTVAIVDNSPGMVYAPLIEDTDEFRFVTVGEAVAGDALFGYYRDNKEAQDLYAIVLLPDSLGSREQYCIFSDQSINASLERAVTQALTDALERERIASFDIENFASIMEQCKVDLTAKSVKWNEAGDEQLSSALVGEVLGMVLALLTYMFVLMYGAMIMNGVIEEKTNRIVEVIVSSCKPMELMLGKILGVALVGFTQIAIWAVLLGIAGMVLGTSALVVGVGDAAVMGDAAAVGDAMAQVQDSDFAEIVQMVLSVDYAQILTFFILYFVGGYLLYAALFAAFGSAVDQPSDASQFMTPIMIVMVFALYAGMFSMENPDGPLAWWCSIIPLTSPIVMMIRLPYDVPVWELALSIALLYGTALGILYIAGKIYRTGILMYGKKTSVAEIVKWLKY